MGAPCQTFVNTDGQKLVAIWQAIGEQDNFDGSEITVTLPKIKAQKVTAIDTLNGFKQELEEK